jgi:tetratricopeptide (TPR) repeat protein
VDWLEQLVDADPENRGLVEQLEEAYRRSGDLQGNPSYFHFGDLEKAKFYHRKALRIAAQLTERDPKDAMARAQFSVALRRMAAVQRTTEPFQAVELYREALEHLRSLLDQSPADLNYQRDFANTQLGLAAALKNANRLKPALDAATMAISMQRTLLAKNPERLVIREDLFDSIANLAEIHLAMRDFDSAFASYQEALALAQVLYDNKGENLYSERCLAIVYQGLGHYYAALPNGDLPRNKATAQQWYGKALAIWSRWHSHNVAVPYSANREKEILRLSAAVAPQHALLQ